MKEQVLGLFGHFLTGWLVLEKWMAPDLFSMVPSVATAHLTTTPVISLLDASDARKSHRNTNLHHARRRMSDHSYPKAVPKHVRSFANCFCCRLVLTFEPEKMRGRHENQFGMRMTVKMYRASLRCTKERQ